MFNPPILCTGPNDSQVSRDTSILHFGYFGQKRTRSRGSEYLWTAAIPRRERLDYGDVSQNTEESWRGSGFHERQQASELVWVLRDRRFLKCCSQTLGELGHIIICPKVHVKHGGQLIMNRRKLPAFRDRAPTAKTSPTKSFRNMRSSTVWPTPLALTTTVRHHRAISMRSNALHVGNIPDELKVR
jgi:hypothetical protein